MTIYKLSHTDTYWDGTVEIDHNNPEAAEAMQQAVEFWMGWESRLADNDGDYTKMFLKNLGQKLVLMQLRLGYKLEGIIREMKEEEGWPLLDGSCGIKLLRCDVAEIGEDDIFIEEQKEAAHGTA